MNRLVSTLAMAALSVQFAAMPAQARMSDDEKAAAAIAILGIAALAHKKHHYREGYQPDDHVETAEFERGYRDGVHGYPYWENSRTRGYVQGYQAGTKERENSMAHRHQAEEEKAPHMAVRGCADIVASNFAVSRHDVHMIRSSAGSKHEWLIEAAVGHNHMVCTMRDTGEVIDLRGGRL
jgi:hypothetical protein